MKDPILVWQFNEAPEEYRKMSRHGGDEDWLAIVPKEMKDAWIPWLEDGGPFGCSSVSQQPLEDGRVLFIGAHA